MDVYDTEEEQIDAIKKWWKQNGKAVIIGAVLGFGSLVGWQQWQANLQAARESASFEYDVLLSDLENNNYQGVKDRGAHILNEYSDTAYAAMSAMTLAKIYVEENDFSSAKTYLQVVIDQDEQPQLKQVAQLRMSRLLLAEGNASQALSMLNTIKTDSFAAVSNELEGDIHISLGNMDQARAAYQRALDAVEPGMDPSVLQMKLDDVGGPEANS